MSTLFEQTCCMGKSGLGSVNVKAADEKAVKNEVQVLFNLRSII